MTREELIKILDKENSKPDEMATDWVYVSRYRAIDAMVAAYNRALEDAQNKAEGFPYIYIPELESLKIQ